MTREVLTIDNAAHPNNRARLHAEGCSMLRVFNGRRAKKIVKGDDEYIRQVIATLEEDGYPVKRCKCLKDQP